MSTRAGPADISVGVSIRRRRGNRSFLAQIEANAGGRPIALMHRMSLDQLEQRVSQLALHRRIDRAFRQLQEYLRSKHTWGARHASVRGPGRWRTSPPSSACTNRCRSIRAGSGSSRAII